VRLGSEDKDVVNPSEAALELVVSGSQVEREGAIVALTGGEEVADRVGVGTRDDVVGAGVVHEGGSEAVDCTVAPGVVKHPRAGPFPGSADGVAGVDGVLDVCGWHGEGGLSGTGVLDGDVDLVEAAARVVAAVAGPSCCLDQLADAASATRR
jgi:hypothetical protein